MRLSDDLAVLELPMDPEGTRMMSLSLLLDPEQGATLVDTGLPGMGARILALAEPYGQPIRRILITHNDIDHIGSLHDLAAATGAEVLAFETEAPYVEGKLPWAKIPPPERLATMPRLKAMFDGVQPTPVDRTLRDGEILPFSGGVQVIATPGHTPGHCSLFLQRTKTLITGDAMTSQDGVLDGPNEQATKDVPLAKRSVKRLAELDVQTLVCYHGGVVYESANDQLARVAGS